MALGPGKYDDLCTYVREQAKADGAIVIVINGAKGNGVAMQAPLTDTLQTAEMLEFVAAEIRRSGPF